MKQTQIRQSSRGPAFAQKNEFSGAYDRRVMHRAEASLEQIRKVLDGRDVRNRA